MKRRLCNVLGSEFKIASQSGFLFSEISNTSSLLIQPFGCAKLYSLGY